MLQALGETNMKIVMLVENTVKDTKLKPKFGLSIYIETSKHKILLDLGPDDTYLHNARKMGIDLTEVDTVVLSHGHFDHGGGLASFININSKAKIYIHELAFEPHYLKILFLKKYAGLDKKLVGNERFIMIKDSIRIDDELFLFSDVDGQLETKNKRMLLKKTAHGYIQDDFKHEQSLIVTESNKVVLFSACSHRGIDNILRSAQKHQPEIHFVFGGFHLYNPLTKTTESTEMIKKLAEELALQKCVFYTCHCTGKMAFEYMRKFMSDKLLFLSTGSIVDL